jgi:hypothetical protein
VAEEELVNPMDVTGSHVALGVARHDNVRSVDLFGRLPGFALLVFHSIVDLFAQVHDGQHFQRNCHKKPSSCFRFMKD